jgi:hypothetical protein
MRRLDCVCKGCAHVYDINRSIPGTVIMRHLTGCDLSWRRRTVEDDCVRFMEHLVVGQKPWPQRSPR